MNWDRCKRRCSTSKKFPDNFDDPYFDYETFVEKTVKETLQDGDPDDTGYEMEFESEESSDT